MLGQNNKEVKNGDSAKNIAIRDAVIIFIISAIAVFIAYPPFNMTLVEWLKKLYVPLLTALLTAVTSYAHAIGVKKKDAN